MSILSRLRGLRGPGNESRAVETDAARMCEQTARYSYNQRKMELLKMLENSDGVAMRVGDLFDDKGEVPPGHYRTMARYERQGLVGREYDSQGNVWYAITAKGSRKLAWLEGFHARRRRRPTSPS